MNALISKLERFAKLSDVEKHALHSAVTRHRRHGTRHTAIVDINGSEGVTVILAGLACRYKMVRNGRKQVLGYLIAGDICRLRMSSVAHSGYSLGTFGPTETAVLSLEAILKSPDCYPNLTRALLWSMLVEESTTREWVANVGHRTAYERVAHLFCEMYLRLQLVGLADNRECELPLTQRDLGDALALSAVHVNRVLMQMRVSGLLSFRGGQLVVPDLVALQAAAGFDGGYLHCRN